MGVRRFVLVSAECARNARTALLRNHPTHPHSFSLAATRSSRRYAFTLIEPGSDSFPAVAFGAIPHGPAFCCMLTVLLDFFWQCDAVSRS